MSKLPIVVIETPGLNRANNLCEQIKQSDRFQLIRLLATDRVNGQNSNQWSKTENFSKLIYGRALLEKEVCCSISHNNARMLISKYPTGGVILEDDARIISDERFYETVSNFLAHAEGPRLLNLSTHKSLEHKSMKFLSRTLDSGFFSISGPARLAVGYALTAKAARALVEENTPVKYLADWPLAEIKFFASDFPSIAHGDKLTLSTIDPSGKNRKDFSKAKKIEILFSVYFFRNRHMFESYKKFIIQMLVPRYKNKTTRLKIFIKRLTNKYNFEHRNLTI
jgi:GR25 family glycosyltransferase involved in LPS biosynthesis